MRCRAGLRNRVSDGVVSEKRLQGRRECRYSGSPGEGRRGVPQWEMGRGSAEIGGEFRVAGYQKRG